MEKRYFVLIPGRHDFPENEGYVYPDGIENTQDYEGMSNTAHEFLARVADIHPVYGVGLNSCEDSLMFVGSYHLCVYVTGLTSATAALIGACAENGVALTLLHFNKDTGCYDPQPVLPELV